MSAARNFAPVSSWKASRLGATRHAAAGQIAGRDITSRPAFSANLTPEQCQYAEGVVGKANLKVVVNAAIFSALKERAEDHGERRKIVARELGVSEGTVKKLRANTAGVSFETIQAICQRDPSIRALVIQSLGGDVVGFDPGAINQVLRGSDGR